jgi:Transcriptional regulator, AbiEi antitoxin/Protein of unknown function (DUF559)
MQSRPPDLEMAALAGRQYGVVSRAQLIEIGMTESAVDRRLRAGRVYSLHPGVYAVGHLAVSREGRWLAAVMLGGADAVLSHRSAAALWGILRGGERGRVEVTTPRKTRSAPTIHRHCMRLVAGEVATRRRIPVTTLPRTILDIAAGLSDEGLEAAVREAEYLHRLRLRDLDALLVRHRGQRGAATLRSCLRRLGHGPRGRVRSRLEVRFAGLLARTDLPLPALNAVLHIDGLTVEADCLWRAERVIVELDGGMSHGTRAAFEADRERDRRLQAAGWRVVRVTWRQLDEPRVLLADLRQLLHIAESAATVA